MLTLGYIEISSYFIQVVNFFLLKLLSNKLGVIRICCCRYTCIAFSMYKRLELRVGRCIQHFKIFLLLNSGNKIKKKVIIYF